MKKIDLNADLGEGFGYDDALLSIVTSANVCCGVHAGDPELTRLTVEKCLERGVRVGAHPGYPDRDSMGRRPMEPGKERVYLDSILSQIRSFCYAYPAAYLKPHGAFYNDTARVLAQNWDSMTTHPTARSPYEAGGVALSEVPGTGVLIMALRLTRVALMGLPGTMHEPIAARAGSPFIREGFADRRYLADGRLAPRSEPGAVLTEAPEVVEQAISLAASVDSICLHGDTPDAAGLAEAVRVGLERAGFEVTAAS
jgi:UPF0271 protein